MYDHTGKRVKTWAKVFGFILFIGGVAACIYFLTNKYSENDFDYYYSYWENKDGKNTKDDYIGWICLGGAVLSLLISWFFCKLGQLMEDVSLLRWRVDRLSSYRASQKGATANKNVASVKLRQGEWLCSCGQVNQAYTSTCNCGTTKRDVMQAAEKPESINDAFDEEWICVCGKSNKKFATACECGRTKYDNENA